MNLLLSAYACRPDMGSEPGGGWNWAKHLAQAGHSVWCFTAEHNRPYVEAHLQKHPVARLQMVYVAAPTWVEELRRRHYQTFLYVHYWYWQRAAYRRAQRLHASVSFDIVHHVTYGSLQMGSRLDQLNVPFIFGPVGGGQSAPRAFRAYLRNGWHIEQLRNVFSRSFLLDVYHTTATLRAADLVLTTNQETYARARQLGARQVAMVLDSGLSSEFYPARLPERPISDTLRLLWVGSMIPRKGVLFLLAMMAHLPDSVTLTLVGDGPQYSLVQRRIKDQQLGHQVTCAGRVPYHQVQHYYADHDVFVFSSLRDSFGTQLLEAMAYGLPVVTLDHQGAHTFVPDDAGIKVRPSDPDTTLAQLSQAILRLQNCPEERAAMGRRAHAYAQTQLWPHKVDDMMRQYESLLAYSL